MRAYCLVAALWLMVVVSGGGGVEFQCNLASTLPWHCLCAWNTSSSKRRLPQLLRCARGCLLFCTVDWACLCSPWSMRATCNDNSAVPPGHICSIGCGLVCAHYPSGWVTTCGYHVSSCCLQSTSTLCPVHGGLVMLCCCVSAAPRPGCQGWMHAFQRGLATQTGMMLDVLVQHITLLQAGNI